MHRSEREPLTGDLAGQWQSHMYLAEDANRPLAHATSNNNSAGTVWLSVRTLPGGALVVWPETLSQTPWLINKSAGDPHFKNSNQLSETSRIRTLIYAVTTAERSNSAILIFLDENKSLHRVYIH